MRSEKTAKKHLNVLAYGFKLSENFGGPSVLHGFRAALGELRPDARIFCYQPAVVDPISVSDMDFPVYEYPYTRQIKAFARDWLLQKVFRRLPKDPRRRQFWRDYRFADVVVNIYAICFCGNWGVRAASTRRAPWKRCMKSMLEMFLPNLVARVDGKVSVKSTASYGPLCTDFTRVVARWASRYCFGRMVAREEESRRQMLDLGCTKEMPVAPDLANMMPFTDVVLCRKRVGLVTSFQMERKWNGPDAGYLQSMLRLVDHVRTQLGCEVLLVPNQLNGPDGRGDVEVANDILAALPEKVGVKVFDAGANGALAMKAALAGCEVVVSPRYHACVAALSAGVPLLTIGWHYKYQDLMALYGQSERMLPSEECSADRLLAAFDDLWRCRVKIREEIVLRGVQVREAVLNSVKYMLEGRR